MGLTMPRADATRGFALRLILLFGVSGFAISRKHFTTAVIWVGFGALVIIAGLIKPVWLNPLHHAFGALGSWLRERMTQTALVLLYYGVLTPMAYIARWVGKRFLELKIDPQADSYFTRRTHKPGDEDDAAAYEKGY
jgi:hypothetical protein